MKDNFDINVCYKKVFRMLGNEGTIDQMVNDIAEYTNTSVKPDKDKIYLKQMIQSRGEKE